MLCSFPEGSSWSIIILGVWEVVYFYGPESQVLKILYRAVPSFDYEEGPGLHKSDISCVAVTDITSQPYIFLKYAQKLHSSK